MKSYNFICPRRGGSAAAPLDGSKRHMARPDEALSLLRQGMNPVEIPRYMGITVTSVLDYLDRKIGAGQLRRSDVYFSISQDRRRTPPSREYREVVERYADAATAYGDMYDDIRGIESTLHKLIRSTLQDAFGPEEKGWWRQGVPEKVRVKCQERRERDEGPSCEAYGYTDLLDLALVVEANWKQFVETLPGQLVENRKELLASLGRLNRVRNRVMHPAREAPPTEEEFEFVRRFKNALASV